MGIETALLATAVGSSLYQGYKGGKAQKKNEKAQQAAYEQNSRLIKQQQAGMGPGSGEIGLEDFLSSYLKDGGLEGSTAFNSSQDALMQMINRSAADYLGNAGVQLDELATTGGRQDVSELLKALGVQQSFATEEQSARLNASTSGLGQLAGTAARIGEARLRSSMQRDNNVLNAGIQNTAMENAQNRRLAAAGQLGQLNLGAGQLRLGSAQGLAGLASLLNQARGQTMAGYGTLAQAQTNRQGQSNDLLRLLLGNAPPTVSGTSPMAGAIGDAATNLFLMRALGKKTPTVTKKAA